MGLPVRPVVEEEWLVDSVVVVRWFEDEWPVVPDPL